MMRTQLFKLARATPATRRNLTVSAIRAAEGDTGATRAGGVKSSYASRMIKPMAASVD